MLIPDPAGEMPTVTMEGREKTVPEATYNLRVDKRSVLGNPLHKVTLDRHLKERIKDAKVKQISIHGLRHTSATLLLKAGVLPHVVQRRLGHRNISMTLDIYGHVVPSMQQEAAERLATLLHG